MLDLTSPRRRLNPHPLIRIRFESLDHGEVDSTYDWSARRDWYSVPSAGDHVELSGGDIWDRDGKAQDFLSGTVKVVMWGDRFDDDDVDVVVRLT